MASSPNEPALRAMTSIHHFGESLLSWLGTPHPRITSESKIIIKKTLDKLINL